MEEVTVAVIAIAFGLSAVFIPTAFISGIYRPVLPAIRPDHRHVDADFGVQFLDAEPGAGGHPAANRMPSQEGLAHAAAASHVRLVVPRLQRGIRREPRASMHGWCGLRTACWWWPVYAGLLGLTYFGFMHVPTGFVPSQDKGYLLITAQLPDAASLERTQEVMGRIDEIARGTPGVAHRVGIAGQSVLLGSNASNFGSMYVVLEFHHRHGPDLYSDAIADRLRQRDARADRRRADRRIRGDRRSMAWGTPVASS